MYYKLSVVVANAKFACFSRLFREPIDSIFAPLKRAILPKVARTIDVHELAKANSIIVAIDLENACIS
ncbi:hypothetical protein CES85_3487 (plasmid) [Ochrobactrum quorumnocens]|uniref:Uncharacterized protein n=1 Tax=Ochrobactrum quorumnocens TaxID=271865 RepID=A0A248UPP5_9HYPH|nr:hypothetical protein CES85_3487 [[Ochrobactrum] quorumnocens]